MSLDAVLLFIVTLLLCGIAFLLLTTQRVLFGPLVDLLDELRLLRRTLLRPAVTVQVKDERYHLSNDGNLAAEQVRLEVQRDGESTDAEFTTDVLRPGDSVDTGVACAAPGVLCRVRYGSINRHHHYRTEYKDGRNAVLEGHRSNSHG